ncbi:MAG: cytochrome ubiquinol oxidase subunit I [Spirochaetales bacterium]|nr:cytochrome ubiquinol oxidase subunit I [Spirochaetales bacterium]
MDLALLLSRIQYGVSLGTHFIFPPTTLGLSLFILLAESFYMRTKKEVYRDLSSFAVRILTLVFALGVATGLTLPVTLGTNWAQFSKISGSVFGVQLAVEAVVAFTLESVFIGVLFFGRKKVKPMLYWWSTLLVFVGSHFSAFIIIAANSWMQTPAGVHYADGKLILDNWLAMNFNPSSLLRFFHTVAAAWLVGTFLLFAISAYFMYKGREQVAAAKMMTIAGTVALICSLALPILGHASVLEIEKYQPIKGAAMEGVYNSQTDAPLYALGWVDEKDQKVIGLPLPGMLSYFYDFNFNYKVRGLNELAPNPADRPPVQSEFQTFRVMVMVGSILIVVLVLGMIFHARGTLTRKKKSLIAIMICTPLPYIGVETGWITAEIGRQPWTIYPDPAIGFPGLRTADAVTQGLNPGYVLFSLIFFSLVYILIFVVFFRFLPTMVKKGITPPAETPEQVKGGQQ